MKVKQFHGMDVNHRSENPEDWRISSVIEVPGLGDVSITDCLSEDTLEKMKAEIIFALQQKMGIKQ